RTARRVRSSGSPGPTPTTKTVAGRLMAGQSLINPSPGAHFEPLEQALVPGMIRRVAERCRPTARRTRRMVVVVVVVPGADVVVVSGLRQAQVVLAADQADAVLAQIAAHGRDAVQGLEGAVLEGAEQQRVEA